MLQPLHPSSSVAAGTRLGSQDPLLAATPSKLTDSSDSCQVLWWPLLAVSPGSSRNCKTITNYLCQTAHMWVLASVYSYVRSITCFVLPLQFYGLVSWSKIKSTGSFFSAADNLKTIWVTAHRILRSNCPQRRREEGRPTEYVLMWNYWQSDVRVEVQGVFRAILHFSLWSPELENGNTKIFFFVFDPGSEYTGVFNNPFSWDFYTFLSAC